MHPYERWTLRRYLANALKSSRFARPPRADCDIVAWIESHSRLLGLPDLAPETARVESMGDKRSADPFGALEGVARRGDPHGQRAGAKPFAASEAPRLARAGVFAQPCSEPGPRPGGSSNADAPGLHSHRGGQRPSSASASKAPTVLTFIPFSRRARSAANSPLQGDFPNWV